MRTKILIVLSIVGLIASLTSAYVYGIQKPALPPAFNPASDPYARGVYANGIIESDQPHGENVNIYPEVAGVVTRVLVSEGQTITRGTPLFELDDSIQAANVAQLKSQAQAAQTLLEELRAQPRKETLDVASAQVNAAAAAVKTAADEDAKQRRSYEINSKSVSRDVLDTAANNLATARANLKVAKRQYELVRAGAWTYDIQNQQNQYEALQNAAASAEALLAKYHVKATVDGVVLAVNTAVGSYVSPTGSYETYSRVYTPVAVLGSARQHLAVRCFVDEILIQKLPRGSNMQAQMFVRGTDIRLPIAFDRVQPYVSPKIELSNAITERVDVRVLPVIFRFEKPPNVNLYPGQLVDVYIAAQSDGTQDGTPMGRRP